MSKNPIAVAISAVALAVGLAACGGSTSTANPTAQIRHVEKQFLTAFVSDHPEDSCRFTTNPSQCAGEMLQLKAAGIHASSLLPTNWKSIVAKGAITISGNTATTRDFVGGKNAAKFTKVNGSWLVVVS